MTVENLSVAPGTTTLSHTEREVKAFEEQAAAMTRSAIAHERMAQISTQVGAPLVGNPKAERYEAMVRACVMGGVATDVEGFLKFAEELCDGIDRKFPETAPV
jgi:hypothetical protein